MLAGFVAGEGASVTQTMGTYADPNAGAHAVTASLGTGDFAANGGTLLSNYVLPTSAAGLGTITRAVLTATIVDDPTKTYDGTNAATLGGTNFALSGFAPGEGASVSQTAGLYDSANAGTRTVTAGLSAGDFTATGGTQLSNYILPTSATGSGTIERAVLLAAIVGNPTRTYNGSSSSTLTSANYALTGFVAGEGAQVTETSATYDGPNAGAHIDTALLGSGDFVANSGTLLSNYVLPTEASGDGTILRADLTVSITGNPTKSRDGNTDATLKPGDYTIAGFLGSHGASITQTHGTYASPDPGQHEVTALLAPSDYLANQGTLLSNYNLPDVATGPGTILYAFPCASVVLCMPDLPDVQAKVFGGTFARFYVVYPSVFARYQGHTQGFAAMPSILDAGGVEQGAGGWTVRKRSAVLNSAEQILNRGGGSMEYRIQYDPPLPAVGPTDGATIGMAGGAGADLGGGQ